MWALSTGHSLDATVSLCTNATSIVAIKTIQAFFFSRYAQRTESLYMNTLVYWSTWGCINILWVITFEKHSIEEMAGIGHSQHAHRKHLRPTLSHR